MLTEYYCDITQTTPETDFTFFWRETEQNGYLSNWFPAPFDIGLHTFATSEHYMMWSKAMLMGDLLTASKILQATSPKQVKALGRQVTPWNEQLWCAERCRVMYEACYAKFSAHPDLKDLLLGTNDSVLVEASPMDKIWGIGLRESSPDAKRSDRWKGENLLGRVLMCVRRDLLAEKK